MPRIPAAQMPPALFKRTGVVAVVDDDFEELPKHEPAWAALDRITRYRKQLLAAGYWVVPTNGKRPHLDDWVNIRATNAIVDTWAVTRADHLNTGILTRDTPFVDIDVTDEEVAEEIEALFESEIENSAVRIGLPPKRAIPFRTDTPFKKMATQFIAPSGLVHKVEILGDGQQIVVNGIHPDTALPYRWHGGEPGPTLRREDLPIITAETRCCVSLAAQLRSCGTTAGRKSQTGNQTAPEKMAMLTVQQVTANALRSASALMRVPRSTVAPKNWPQRQPAAAMRRLTKKLFGSAP